MLDGETWPGTVAPRCSTSSRRARSGDDRGWCAGRGRGRRAGLLAGRDECGGRGLPDVAGRQRPGPHRRRGHVRAWPAGSRRIVADALGHRARPRPDRLPRLRLRADLAGQRRQHDHVLGRARDPSGRRGRRRGGCCEAAAIELEIAVEDLELMDGTVRPRGTPERAIPIAKLVRANARAGREPIEAHGHAENPGLAPSVAGHVAARPRRPRDRRDRGARGPRRPGRRARAESRSRGGPAARRARRRRSAGRRSRQLVHDENGQLPDGHVPRLRDAAAGGRRAGSGRRASRCRRRRGRSARRASARRRSSPVRRRSRTRWPRRPACACATCR